MPTERFKYYFFTEDYVVKGANDKNELIVLGFHNESTIIDTFVIGKKVLHLKFNHQPISFDTLGNPNVFIVCEYNIQVSNLPISDARFSSINTAILHFEALKNRLAKGRNHREPMRMSIGDLTPYLNIAAVIDIPLEIAPENDGTGSIFEFVHILDSAQDDNGIFLYPLYAKINHPVEQFWVRVIKRDIKYYGIVENKLEERDILGFNYLDVVTFGVPHIKQLI